MARTLDNIILALEELAESGDPEQAHYEADCLLIEALESMEDTTGYGRFDEIRDAFQQVPKWYA